MVVDILTRRCASPEARLRARLRPEGDCLVIFSGALTDYGYGRIYVSGRGVVLTHRLAWELEHGPIPPGVKVLHHCDNPPCCNAHGCLFLGTSRDNTMDALAKGRLVVPQAISGESHPLARYSDVQVVSMRSRYALGERPVDLVAEYGVSRSQFWKIISGTARRRTSSAAQLTSI